MEKLRYQFSDHHFHINSIYNATAQIRAESLDGRTPIQRLIDMIVEMPQYRFDVHYNSNGELLSFFFAHEDGVARFNRFPSVLLMDATYKTNRLKMPLLEVVGMTSGNKAFFLCRCFMTKEATSDYTWALPKMRELCFIDASPEVIATDKERALISAIEEVLPGTQNLLCRWHIDDDGNVFTEEGNEMDALAEEEYSRQVFQAEERERFRANLNQYRDQQPIFTAEICNDLNERLSTFAPHQRIIVKQMVRDLLLGKMPFELQTPPQFTPRGRPTALMVNASSQRGSANRHGGRGSGNRRGSNRRLEEIPLLLRIVLQPN